jgi:hypothetical protein
LIARLDIEYAPPARGDYKARLAGGKATYNGEGNSMNKKTFKLVMLTVLVLALSLWLGASVVLAGMGWSG